MADKRGFGLVGDYGSDSSSSSDEEGETGKKKAKKQAEETKVDQIEERKRKEQKRLSERECDRWAGVRKEYDDSSLMYKYVTEDDSRPEIAATEVPSSELSAEARQTIYKEAYEASLYQRNEKKNADQQALDWEIAQIQTDIKDQRKRWEAVYSSDEEVEAGGAETQAVVTDMKRRDAVVAAVVEEVTKKEVITHRALAHVEMEAPMQHGERWKRLQLIAQSRKKMEPERYGTTYPGHKFPMRD